MHQRNSNNSATNFLSIYTKRTGKPQMCSLKLLIKNPPTNCMCGRKPINTASTRGKKGVQPFVHVKDAVTPVYMYIELLTPRPKAVLGVAQTSVVLLAHIDTPPDFTDPLRMD